MDTYFVEKIRQNAEKYKTQYELSFNTGKGSNYSQKVGK